MTPAEIMRWQEEMYLFSCLLYEGHWECVVTDESFDRHCQRLLDWYDETAPEFQARVPRENLIAGTGLGLQFTDAERAGAFEWFGRIRGRQPGSLDDI